MSRNGNVDLREFEKLRKQLEASSKETTIFIESCAKELAARLLAMTIKRTPTRKPENCPPGVKGGTLKRGWLGRKSGSGAEGLNSKGGTQYAQSLKVHHYGNAYVIEIENPTEYASYVEFGHRSRGKGKYVPPKHMLTLSEEELRRAAPKILEAKIQKRLKEMMK